MLTRAGLLAMRRAEHGCRPLIGLVFALALSAHGPAVAADVQPLALDEARRIAVERSPLIAANAANAHAAREMAVQAGQRPDPVLKLGATNVPIEGPDRLSLDRDFMTMASIGVMQELPSDAKRKARADRSTREAEVAEATRAAQAVQIEREAGLAWLDRSYLQRLRELLDRQLIETRLLVPATEAAYRAGRGARADLFSARAAIEQIADRIDAVDVQIATVTARLTRWIGDDAFRPPASLPPMDRAPFAESEATLYIEQHPAIEVARRQEALASAEVNLAERQRDRDWSIELMYSRRGRAFTDMVSVNVSVPILWNPGQRQDRELAARLAMREAARAQVEDQRRMQVAEARALLREWIAVRDRIRRYDTALLPLARQRSEAAVTAYRAGSGILIVALEARRSMLDVEMERLRLEIDAARVWMQLDTLRASRHLPNTLDRAGAIEQERSR